MNPPIEYTVYVHGCPSRYSRPRPRAANGEAFNQQNNTVKTTTTTTRSKHEKQTLSLPRPLNSPGLVGRAKISTCNEAINNHVFGSTPLFGPAFFGSFLSPPHCQNQSDCLRAHEATNPLAYCTNYYRDKNICRIRYHSTVP